MKAIDIGSRLELLVDDYLVEKFYGDIELRLQKPTPQEVVFPLEHGPYQETLKEKKCGLRAGHGYMTVFREGDIFKMYYSVSRNTLDDDLPTKRWLHYAESTDGINWRLPSLGLVEYEGSKENNIVRTCGLDYVHDLSPFRDGNPNCNPSEQYKAVTRNKGGEKGLCAVCSHDGLSWEKMKEKPVITDGAFDTQNVAFWDGEREEYRAYWREFFLDANENNYRGVKTAVSNDFIHWSQPQWLNYPGAETEQLYTNQVIPYYRAPHIFVGLPTRYVERPWSHAIEALPETELRRSVIEDVGGERIGTAITDTQFMCSRDGVNFRRYGEAFIRPGLRYKDSWMYGDIYANWGIVETSSGISGAPDEMTFYVSERSRRYEHSKAFRRYTLRVDGFVSANASRRGGEFVTRPLTFNGDEMEVNFSASAAGRVRVEIQDVCGAPLPGFSAEDCVELLGDDLKRKVAWKNNPKLRALEGQPVRLRFHLVDADLFSFRFK